MCHGEKSSKTCCTAQYMPQEMKVGISLFTEAHSINTFSLHDLYVPGTAVSVGNTVVRRGHVAS